MMCYHSYAQNTDVCINNKLKLTLPTTTFTSVTTGWRWDVKVVTRLYMCIFHCCTKVLAVLYKLCIRVYVYYMCSRCIPTQVVFPCSAKLRKRRWLDRKKRSCDIILTKPLLWDAAAVRVWPLLQSSSYSSSHSHRSEREEESHLKKEQVTRWSRCTSGWGLRVGQG